MKIKFAILLLASAVAMSNGLAISCTFSTMSMNYVSGSPYTCYGMLTEDGNPDITSITGQHTGGMTDANVQGIYFSQSGSNFNMDRLPSNLAAKFPNLVFIQADYVRLKYLTKADLQPFPNLVYASFQMNLLRVLEGDLFKYNPYLQYVNLAYNSIELVGPGFMSNLPELTHFEFNQNRCLGQQMYMYVGQGYTIQDYINDVNFLCGPDESSSGGIDGSCPAECNASAAALQAQISAVELVFTEPWWVRLRAIIKVWFNL